MTRTKISGLPSGSGQDVRAIRGVVFDCDGVLFDSRGVNAFYYNHIRAVLGLDPMSPEEEEYTFMHTVDKALERIIPEELKDRAREAQSHMTYADFIDRMTPEPGVFELLAMLHDREILLAVNTNRKNSMELLLERFALTAYFYPVMTAAKVARPKPDPEGLEVIIRTWGVPREEIVYIGDSSVDEETTRRAGVPFWAYRNPGLEAQLHVDSFHELRQWFEKGSCPIID